MSTSKQEKKLEVWIVQGGDSAVEELFQRYYEKLRDFVERKMYFPRDPGAGASDIAQSALISFCRRRQHYKFRDSNDIWSLLKTIAIHKIIDHRGEVVAQGRRAEDIDMETVLSTDPTPEDAVVFMEVVGWATVKATEGLDPEYKEIVRLRLEDCTQNQIAEKLGCKRGKVRYRLERVGERLRRILDDASRC